MAAPLHDLALALVADGRGILAADESTADDHQAPGEARDRLGPHPWRLTFSYGRALQDPAMSVWGGADERLPAGRDAFMLRARCNGAATRGAYEPGMEASLVA